MIAASASECGNRTSAELPAATILMSSGETCRMDNQLVLVLRDIKQRGGLAGTHHAPMV